MDAIDSGRCLERKIEDAAVFFYAFLFSSRLNWFTANC